MLSVIISCTSGTRVTLRKACSRAVQAAALVATFVNVKLHEHLPHDSSAEAQRIWQFVRRRILICQWTVAAVFGVQVPPRSLGCAQVPCQAWVMFVCYRINEPRALLQLGRGPCSVERLAGCALTVCAAAGR